jgi:hypothetical protein
MKLSHQTFLGFLLLAAMPLGAQGNNPPQQPTPAGYGADDSQGGNSDLMRTPPPVSGQSFSTEPTSTERSNYLRGGVSFTTAYTDNVIGSTGPDSKPLSDISYSIFPSIALDETTSRLHWILQYAPGFTFYQRESGRNQADQNASVGVDYRLSPHVTFSAEDSFQKSSNLFNQPDLSSGSVSGGTQGGNLLVVAPVADLLRNTGNVGISYQFARNEMVGATGTFTNLHYPDQSVVPGLFDSESQTGSAFYALRISKIHYVTVSYQYARLLSFPTEGQNEARTQAFFLSYTISPSKQFSFSVFGGPQYADISPQYYLGGTTPQPGSRTWTGAGGASVSWQGKVTSVAVGYSHIVANGGGLIAPTQTDSATAAFRQRLSRTLGASLTAAYLNNAVIGGLSQVATGSTNGHGILGTASLQQQLGQHMNLQLGYTRLHQNYNVTAISSTPDTNREFVSLSYEFSRPLGR